jgi:H/ACA ribonucleoprotein complex subunit 1
LFEKFFASLIMPGNRAAHSERLGWAATGFGSPPIVIATYNATVEGLMCCSVVEKKVPLLMRSIYMENKTLIGKVDDVFGPITAPGIAIKPSDGVKGEGFQSGDKVRHKTKFNSGYSVTLL